MRLALALALASLAAAEEVSVTFYNSVQLDPNVVRGMLEEMSSIFKTAGIELRIQTGDLQAGEAKSIQYSADKDACRARRDIAVRVQTVVPGSPAGRLAQAFPFAIQGLNVTIFAQYVENASSAYGQPYSVVLAHVTAHEIGHVLQRSTGHSRGGMMASHWGRKEYSLMPKGMLRFSKAEAGRMRETIRGDGCPLLKASGSR